MFIRDDRMHATVSGCQLKVVRTYVSLMPSRLICGPRRQISISDKLWQGRDHSAATNTAHVLLTAYGRLTQRTSTLDYGDKGEELKTHWLCDSGLHLDPSFRPRSYPDGVQDSTHQSPTDGSQGGLDNVNSVLLEAMASTALDRMRAATIPLSGEAI